MDTDEIPRNKADVSGPTPRKGFWMKSSICREVPLKMSQNSLMLLQLKQDSITIATTGILQTTQTKRHQAPLAHTLTQIRQLISIVTAQMPFIRDAYRGSNSCFQHLCLLSHVPSPSIANVVGSNIKPDSVILYIYVSIMSATALPKRRTNIFLTTGCVVMV